MKILIDADALIAIESKSDALHQRAISLLEQLESLQVQYWITWDVLDKVVTKLSYFLSKQQSLALVDFLEIEGVQIVYPNKKRQEKALTIFRKIVSKRVSLTDCVNMAVAKELGVDCIFSFDKIYKQEKLQLLEQVLQRELTL